jgi:hypothetical protein
VRERVGNSMGGGGVRARKMAATMRI